MLVTMTLTDAYAMLELAPGASEGVVRLAYKARALQSHPDKGGTEAEFKQVETALRTIERAGFPRAPQAGSASLAGQPRVEDEARERRAREENARRQQEASKAREERARQEKAREDKARAERARSEIRDIQRRQAEFRASEERRRAEQRAEHQRVMAEIYAAKAREADPAEIARVERARIKKAHEAREERRAKVVAQCRRLAVILLAVALGIAALSAIAAIAGGLTAQPKSTHASGSLTTVTTLSPRAQDCLNSVTACGYLSQGSLGKPPTPAEDEVFRTCGHRIPPLPDGSYPEPCEKEVAAIAPNSPKHFGDDPALDTIYEQCREVGTFNACDELWTKAPVGSDYERFASSCGGRFPESQSLPQRRFAAPYLTSDSFTDTKSEGSCGPPPFRR